MTLITVIIIVLIPVIRVIPVIRATTAVSVQACAGLLEAVGGGGALRMEHCGW